MPPASNQTPAPFPTRDQVIEYIRANPSRLAKRDIARAFRLDAEQKVALRSLLRELEDEGAIDRGPGRRYRQPGQLPSVGVVEIVAVDTDGEMTARPVSRPESGPAPVVYIVPEVRSRSALAVGDRVLARLRAIGPGAYEGRVMRRLEAAPARTLGIYEEVQGGARLRPINKKVKQEFRLRREDAMGAQPGDLVWAEVRPHRALGLHEARVVERIGTGHGPKAIGLITLADHDIPTQFAETALAQAASAGPAPLAGREDLRTLPLVTIDGEDARDFDDAVWAEPDPSPDNDGGWHLLVAIADVSWYVRPGDALDRTAYERGNSVYLPDRVVPMLPEALSNGWCSLVPGEDRPCLAAHLWIDRDGILRRHRFERAMMRSAARLTYRQVQAAADGDREGSGDGATGDVAMAVHNALYGAFRALARARAVRGVLELDMPERKVILGDDGAVKRIERRDRLDSHKLIEEFMITANVAAAEALEGRRMACLYRVHDAPTREKLEALRQFLDSLEIPLARGQVIRPKDFNRVLERAADTPFVRLVNEVVLRSQAQAAYGSDNIGHFGLALRRYCHFTSPIRRYADLTVHRGLIAGLGLGEGGATVEAEALARVGEHISGTEQRAASAERDAVDRYTASFLAERTGEVFPGVIGGVTRFGLFVTLDESGGDGLVPIRSLPDDYYVHDEATHRLVGRSSGREYVLGDRVDVRLIEAEPITGGLLLELIEGDDEGAGRRRPSLLPGSRGRMQTAKPAHGKPGGKPGGKPKGRRRR